MKPRDPWTVLVVWLLLLLPPGGARGDEMALRFSGGAVHPMEAHPNVTMESCRIEGEVGTRETLVSCEFVFVNHGPAANVTMGFPAFAGYGLERPELMVPRLQAFRSWVDGRRVSTRIVPGAPVVRWPKGKGPPNRWYTKAVWFGAGQQRLVRDTYVQPHGWPGGGGFFPYALKTGASWNGPIGRVELILRWTGPYECEWGYSALWSGEDEPESRLHVSPDGREARWTAENLEPQSDILVTFERGWTGLFLDGLEVPLWPPDFTVRVSGDGIWVMARSLSAMLQAELSYEPASKTARLTSPTSGAVEVRPGSPEATVAGQPVALRAAPYTEAGRLWIPAEPILARLGHRAEIDRDRHRVEVYSGGPVACEARCYWGAAPEDGTRGAHTVRLVRVEGVLMGEIYPLMDVVPESEARAIDRSYLFLAHGSRKVQLRWNSTRALLAGKLAELPVAPHAPLLGPRMVPLDAVLGALGLQYRYDEERGTLVLSDAPMP